MAQATVAPLKVNAFLTSIGFGLSSTSILSSSLRGRGSSSRLVVCWRAWLVSAARAPAAVAGDRAAGCGGLVPTGRLGSGGGGGGGAAACGASGAAAGGAGGRVPTGRGACGGGGGRAACSDGAAACGGGAAACGGAAGSMFVCQRQRGAAPYPARRVRRLWVVAWAVRRALLALLLRARACLSRAETASRKITITLRGWRCSPVADAGAVRAPEKGPSVRVRAGSRNKS